MVDHSLLFDFDDCLLDTKEDRLSTTLTTLVENGYPLIKREAAERFLGFPSADRFMKTAGIGDPVEGQRLAELWEQTNVRVGYVTATPYPGVAEALEDLKRFPMGIFSASMTEVIRGALRRTGLDPYFREVIGRDGGAAPKPSPEGLLLLARRLGAAAEDCLYVGDTPNDIRAGHAAGMKTIAVTHGFGTPADLRNENPTGIIDRFEQLPQVVSEIWGIDLQHTRKIP